MGRNAHYNPILLSDDRRSESNMKYFYSSEQDAIISESAIQAEYEKFGKEQGYESYSDYFSSCMYWNNGDLTPINTHIANIRWHVRQMVYADDTERKSLLEYAKQLEIKYAET